MWRLIEFLFALAAEKFWGDIVISLKEGRIITVRTTQQYTEATLPRATDTQRKEMRQPDRELLALMAGEEQRVRPPVHVLAQRTREARGDTGWMK